VRSDSDSPASANASEGRAVGLILLPWAVLLLFAIPPGFLLGGESSAYLALLPPVGAEPSATVLPVESSPPIPAPETLRTAGGHPSGLVGGYAGINESLARCSCGAPNISLAVGPNDTLELVEGHAAFFGTNGGLLSHESLGVFFQNPAHRFVEPVASYDADRHRFLALAIDRTGNLLTLGSSGTSNSTSAWRFVAIPVAPGSFPGSPSIGPAGAFLAIAASSTNGSGSGLGSQLWLIDLSALEAGNTALVATAGPTGYPMGVHAVAARGSPGRAYFVATNATRIQPFTATGAPPGSTFSTPTGTPYIRGALPLPIPQPNSTKFLYAPAPSVASAVWVRGLLALVQSASSGGVDGLELLEVNSTTGSLRENLFVGNGMFLSYPALGADASGDLTVIAVEANSTVYPSLVTVGQPYNEPNATTPFTVLAAGVRTVVSNCSGANGCAWGNTSAAAPDPIDPAEVWVAGEYAGPSPDNWSTYIGVAVYPPLAVTSPISDVPRLDVGQEVNFTVFASGGTGGYVYDWSAGLPPGCLSRNRATVPCFPIRAGSYSLLATVTDGAGTNQTSLPLSFTVDPALSVPAPIANRSSADVGQLVSFQVHPSGGLPPYQYRWSPPGGATCRGYGTSQVNCSFRAFGLVGVGVSIGDLNLRRLSNGTSLLLFPLPALTPPSSSVSPPMVGVPFDLTTTLLARGSGGLTYFWRGLPGGCTSANSSRVTCDPNASGSFAVNVTVRDSNGGSASALAHIVVLPASSPPGTMVNWLQVGIILALLGLAAVVGVSWLSARVRERRSTESDPRPEER
jgi:hypothetical protein